MCRSIRSKEYTMNRQWLAVASVLILSFTVVGLAQAPAGRAWRPARSTGQLAGRERRSAHQLPHLRAAGARDPAECQRHPGLGQNTRLTKADNGVVGADGRAARLRRLSLQLQRRRRGDDRSAEPGISESNNNVWSLVYVPGSDLFDSKAVPHGAVAEVTYKSSTLGRDRRMHVYTPPGYENGRDRYPVFYLLHGAGDNDDSWSTVGRAGFILDNLIATQKAKPMVVVMPAGTRRGSNANSVGRSATDEFVGDFVNDVMPYVEKHYRVLTDRPNTAIAGLSMGGLQTLEVAIPRLERFAYVGVYSSGLIGAFPTPAAAVQLQHAHRRRRGSG
jgi:enterochelin esterase-like enzyme